jgi:hypothetical protein
MPDTSDRVAGGGGRYPDENQDMEKAVGSRYYGRHGERSLTGSENRYYAGYGYRGYGRYPDENRDKEKFVGSRYYGRRGRHGERSSTGSENRYYGAYVYGYYPYAYRGYGR